MSRGRLESVRSAKGSIGAALFAVIVVVMPSALIGPLAVPLQADLGLDESMVGLTLSAYFGAASMAAVFGGRLADRHGWRAAMRASCLITGLVLLAMAAWGRSAVSLVVLFVVAGLSHAVAMPASNIALAEESTARRLGVLLGAKQAAIPVATFLAGLAVGFVVVPFGWEVVVGAFGLMALLASIVVRGSASAEVQLGAKAQVRPRPRPPLLLLAFAGALAAMAVQALNAFAVTAAVSNGLSIKTVGVLVSAGGLLGVVVRVGGGWMADSSRSDGLGHVVTLLVVGAGALLALSTRDATLTLVVLPLSYASVWGWPGLFHLGVVQHHKSAPGAATGVVQAGLSAGAGIGPLLFGFLIASVGYAVMWQTAAVLLVVAALAMGISASLIRSQVA